MKKHLIYLGYTGTAHRIALFDENNVVAHRVPVKDIPVLTDDLDLLNCTVRDGKPYPNLMGAKVICSCPQGKEHTLGWNGRTGVTEKDFRVFKDEKPKYLYGWNEDYRFSPDVLLGNFYGYNFWDGLCKENYLYVIGEIMYSKTPETTDNTGNLLCMTNTGSLFFMTSNTIRVLEKAGGLFVQVGTPELYYPNACLCDGNSCKGVYATVGIPQSATSKVIWVNRRGKEMSEVSKTAEYIWWGGGAKTTICDLRKFSSARVFGISSCAEDASVVILPESTKEMWYGMFYECTSLQAVYIPASIEVIHELGLPPRRFKTVTLYSDSPLVAEFCKRKKVAYKSCSSVDDMLKDFYSVNDSESISVGDATNIASLAGAQSTKKGESGTIWSAVLFSCADKGMVSETLQERYPVVVTCDYAVPVRYAKSVGGNVVVQGEYSKERCRVLAASFTQFYPLFTDEVYDEATMRSTAICHIYRCRMGDYNLYVVKDVLNTDKLPPADKPYRRDYYDNHHIALLEDISKKRIIHRFMCSDMLYTIMLNLEGMCIIDKPPSGVLRYADKLPTTYTRFDIFGSNARHRKDEERLTFTRELFKTLLPVMYGTKTAKQKLAGIDLHTGNLVTLEFLPQHSRIGWGTAKHTVAATIEGVRSVKNIKVYLEDEHLGSWFPKDCVYNKK